VTTSGCQKKMVDWPAQPLPCASVEKNIEFKISEKRKTAPTVWLFHSWAEVWRSAVRRVATACPHADRAPHPLRQPSGGPAGDVPTRNALDIYPGEKMAPIFLRDPNEKSGNKEGGNIRRGLGKILLT